MSSVCGLFTNPSASLVTACCCFLLRNEGPFATNNIILREGLYITSFRCFSHNFRPVDLANFEDSWPEADQRGYDLLTQGGSACLLDRQVERGVMVGSAVLLDVKGVTKSFGRLLAVNDCSLEVNKGTITALIGPNGAGKTTLFNLISGFCRADEGKVLLCGKRIDHLQPHQIFHKGLIRTFQISRELERMTVLENLMLVPGNQAGEWIWNVWFRPWRVARQEGVIMSMALKTLEFIELYHLKDEHAGNLSTGQKRLLEIARTMMADPEVILLDEPGAGVNPTLLNKIIGYIRYLHEKGKTFFIVEHNMDLVMNLCEPIIVMNAGSILAQGAASEIRQDKRVLSAYLGT